MVVSRSVLACGVAFLGAVACGQAEKTPGQLVIAIETDMALPDQIDTIELVVSANDKVLFDYPMPVGAGISTQPIPATLTLVAGSDPTMPVHIRVLGSKGSATRTLREVVTTVPADRVAVLRMPVQWLCDGTAKPMKAADGSMSYESTCGSGATCKAGKCVPPDVPPESVETYSPQIVFGGGSAPPKGGQTSGQCFDTVPCMVSGALQTPDDQCTVPMPSGGSGVNVALRVANDGICDTTGTTCFVPLDGNDEEGWTEEDGRIALPSAVCSKLRAGLIAGVIVSTQCETKTHSEPPCGSWSSVTPPSDAPASNPDDAGTTTPPPPALALLGSVTADAATSTPCCPLMADGSQLYTCLCDASASQVKMISIDPATGNTSSVLGFSPEYVRSRYASVLAGDNFYWVDRLAGKSGDTCPVQAVGTAGGGIASTVATVDGDVYDGADLLADAQALYALADNVAGLAASAAPVQALRIDRGTGKITALDTGGARPVLQLTQDAKALYVAVDTDVMTAGSIERVSRVVRFAKNGGASSTVSQRTVITSDESHGGFIGLQDDGTTLFALSESGADADGLIDTQVLALGDSEPKVLYDELVDPAVVRLRLLGAVNGAVLLVRDLAAQPQGGVAATSSSVLVIPPGGGDPRIVASFAKDTPTGELQAPSFSPDVFWLNSSGRVFQLSGAALK